MCENERSYYTMSNLLILGAGQYGAVVKETAQSMGCFDKISFLDDSFGDDNVSCCEQVIGKLDELEQLRSEYEYSIPAIGDADIRLSLLERAESAGYRIPVIISPRAYVSPSAQISKGSVIEPLAGVHANAVIGKVAYISMGAAVNHNAVVGDGCHVDNNAVVMSGAEVPSRIKVEPGAIVKRQFNIFNMDGRGDLAIDGTAHNEYNFDVGM